MIRHRTYAINSVTFSRDFTIAIIIIIRKEHPINRVDVDTSRKIPYFSRLMTIDATRRNDKNDSLLVEYHCMYIYIYIHITISRVISKILSLLRVDCVDRRVTTQRDKNRFIKILTQIPRVSLVFPSRYPLLDSR